MENDDVDAKLPLKWADDAMFQAQGHALWGEETGVVPQVFLLTMTHDPLGALAAMALMYEGKVVRDLEEVTDAQREKALADVQQTHLQAPLEAIKVHFMLDGVDRAFTHQLVRQRTAVYAQESLRFAVVGDVRHSTSLPPSLMGTKEDDPGVDLTYGTQQQRWRRKWDFALDVLDRTYNELVADGMPAEDARGLLPQAIATRTNYVTDLRNLIAHAGNRLCTQAQFHWRSVFSQIVAEISGYGEANDPAHAWQYQAIADSGMFKPVCYQLGHCPFKASFDRPCSIRDRVDAGKFDEIKVYEWLLDPAAAR